MDNLKLKKKTPLWQSIHNKSWANVFVLLIFYTILFVIFSVLSPWFFSFNNLISIGTNMAFIGIMAAAGTPLIIAGGLDLSVAAIAGMSGILVALLYEAGVNIWVASVIVLFGCLFLGVINGLLATSLKLNPLIVTLGTMSIITGYSLVLTGGLTKPLFIESFNYLGSGRIFFIPVPIILMLVFILAIWFLMVFTKFGRHIYATGGNFEASRIMGIPVVKTQLILYILSSFSGAFAGIMLASMLGAAAPDAAGKHLLTIIAAIILGGTSLFGGKGSIWGTLLAVLILGTLNNGLTLLDVSSFWQDVTRGAVLLLAVGLDQIRTRVLSEN